MRIKKTNLVHGDSSRNKDSMTISNESPYQEVRSVKENFLRPKTKLRAGAWSVRIMYETSKLAQTTNEMKRHKIQILGISEARWTGSGKIKTNDGYTVIFSGNENIHLYRVAVIIDKEISSTLLEWEPISDRLIRARFNSKYCKLSVLQCYALTNDADED
ncbi:craniofacial development protein 2-like [Anneissia japonica]|uniref:craniofacial development protein 2-like n=1 Tax=Anneissia japonica TaxID=1529436 RepID=UPI0014257212|nr:craniofacial development protein 2-like [Anneissia japonica]